MDTITGNHGEVVATVDVSEYAPNRYEGVIINSDFPEDLVTLLREFEQTANDQILSLLDDVERKIAAHKLFFSERRSPISRLQLWGEDGIYLWIEEKSC